MACLTTTFTLAYTSCIKRAAAFKNYSGARWLFRGLMAFYSWDIRQTLSSCLDSPGHRETVTHKYLPQVVYNSATVSCTPIFAAEYIHSIKALSSEWSSVQQFEQPMPKASLFRQQCSWPLVEEGTQSKQEAFGTLKGYLTRDGNITLSFQK